MNCFRSTQDLAVPSTALRFQLLEKHGKHKILDNHILWHSVLYILLKQEKKKSKIHRLFVKNLASGFVRRSSLKCK